MPDPMLPLTGGCMCGQVRFTTYAPVWSPVPDDGLPRFAERLAAGASPSERAA